MKSLVTVLALVLVASMAEAGLPTAVSQNQRARQITSLHSYVQRSTKYTSSEWGSASFRNLKILPVNPHAYVKGRVGF